MAKLKGVYITKDDLDALVRPLIKKLRDNDSDIPKDAKLISVWFDPRVSALLFSYEHESFEELPRHLPVLQFKHVVELDKEDN
jgi:hypothetical protein